MTPAHPLNSREYHEAEAERHTEAAATYAASDPHRAAYHGRMTAWHTAEALAEAPAQTAPEGMPAR